MQSMFDERQWLVWLVKVRILILICLLGIELAISRLTPSTLPVRFFIGSILLWFALAIFYALLLPLWTDYRLQSLLQVTTDLGLVTLVVYATGGVDSSFNFLYPLVIIVGCILLPRRWTYALAGLAFVLFAAVLELTYFGVIRSYSPTHPEMTSLQAIIFVNLCAYLAVAYLAGLLAAKLRQVGVKLKHTSGALESLQALHFSIIDSVSSGLITTGLDGRITLANPAAQKQLGRTESELHSLLISELFQDVMPRLEPGNTHSEVRFVTKEGYRKTFRIAGSALSVEQGIIGFVYTLDDLTEIRRLEREVRLQDRLAAVGRLAAAIAHEIRNPLTSIAGSVSMLAEVPDLSEEHRQLLQIVTRESDRLNDIITDFLSYSREKHYAFANGDLLALLEDTLTLLEHRLTVEKSGIEVQRNYAVPEAYALIDGDKLKQVFWNICENAVRAMARGGVLRVSIEAVDEDWQINFADTGPGIEPKLIEKVFEPFQSQFEGGTGLGLAIVYQIMQAHEGKVWARSKPGQGTVFVLRIRRASTARPQAGARKKAGSHQPRAAVATQGAHG